MFLTSVLGLIFVFPILVLGILPIHIKSYRFIKPSSPDNDPESNEVFFVKGVDFQPGGSSGYDPISGIDTLSDPEVCARNAYVFQQLGINTIRIYSLNPEVNHDECMTILNNAGIYVILDVNSGNDNENLNRADPETSYNSVYLNRVFRFIDAFKNYPNVLGFFAGNEVINDENNYAQIDPQYIRAVQRDMKQYISKNSNRTIPVGYSSADNDNLRLATFKYLQCNSINGTVVEELDMSRSDFFGLNTYSWCSGTSNWETSGYEILNTTFSDAVIPLIFSEYGCNLNSPRTFDEVSNGLYGGLVNTFSGGLVYEFDQQANNYGLVTVDDDGNVSYLEDFINLQDQYEKLDLPTITESSLSDETEYNCDADKIKSIYQDFGVSDFALPSQPTEIASMIEHGASGNNTGFLLSDYTTVPSFSYNVKNQDGNLLTPTLSFASSNLLNTVKGAVSATFSSSVTKTSKSMPTSNSDVTSSSTASNLSSKSEISSTKAGSSKKSKGGANAKYSSGIKHNVLLFIFGIFAILL